MGLAVCIKRHDDVEKVLKQIINNDEKLKEIKINIQKFAKPNAAKDICKVIFDNI